MTDAPFRRQFDAARDPYAARNALGITGTGGGGTGPPGPAGPAGPTGPTGPAGVVSATPPLALTGGNLTVDLSGYQPLDADLTAIAALTGTDVIYYRSAANIWSPVTIGTNLTFSGGTLNASGGGGGSPGGSTTQMQYNNAGAFGGAANLTWNNTTSVLTLTGQLAINIGSATSVLAAGVVQAASFKCAGTNAVLGPDIAGTVTLRPNGVASATGQLLIAASGAVTSAGPVTLPADPTANLQAATKQYVDARITPTYPPQGRLTLQTATPVMTLTQAAKTTIFYTPYVGNKVPIYDGTSMAMTTFAELSVATTDTTKNPAAVGASQCLDWFIWSDAGTLRLSHGPAWTNDTTRSAGTALVMVQGLFLNNASLTNACAAQRGTYVGTTRSNASSQLDWILGGVAAGGIAANLAVWNCYNRVLVTSTTQDSTASFSIGSSPLNFMGSANNRCSFLAGLGEDSYNITATSLVTAGAGGGVYIGVGLDTTATYSGQPGSTNVNQTSMLSGSDAGWALGYHYYQMLNGAVVANGTAYGGAIGGGIVNALRFSGRM